MCYLGGTMIMEAYCVGKVHNMIMIMGAYSVGST